MEYTAAEDNYFVFSFDDTINLINHLECRYAEYDGSGVVQHHYPSVDCDIANGDPTEITMKLHPWLDIQASTRYEFIID